MTLFLDVGNTHTHIALGDAVGLHLRGEMPTAEWGAGRDIRLLFKRMYHRKGAVLAPGHLPDAVWFCSVVPAAVPGLLEAMRDAFGRGRQVHRLTWENVRGLEIDYPKPETIGQDRLANAVAARHHFGAPVLVVDFGTAVTFDVVDRRGNYVGGVIAPGLAAMTDYLHEKTALLPRIEIREPRRVIGRSTKNAMLSGAVHGYRGLIRGLIGDLRRELGAEALPVVATGGYAGLIASGMPEIREVRPGLTLEGLRLVALAHGTMVGIGESPDLEDTGLRAS